MLGYIMVGTNDLAKAAGFYDPLLAELGAKRIMEGSDVILWGTEDGGTRFCVVVPRDGNPATVGNGSMVALSAPDHATVDKIHAMALEMGARDEGAVGPRPKFNPDFYAGYFRDPDGNKLNVFNFPMP